jgi:hypothetical protein
VPVPRVCGNPARVCQFNVCVSVRVCLLVRRVYVS